MSAQTPLKAIRWCPLYPYRMGKKPQGDNLSNEEDSAEKTEIAHSFLQMKAFGKAM